MLAAAMAADWAQMAELDLVRREQIRALTIGGATGGPAALDRLRQLDRDLVREVRTARERLKADLAHLQQGRKAAQAYTVGG